MPAQPEPDIAETLASLAELASEGWRYVRGVERLADSLDLEQRRRLAARSTYFHRQLEAALSRVQCNLVTFDGQSFSPSLAATAVNIADFAPDMDLAVDQTLEPAIVGPYGVLRMGTVAVKAVAR